jgi:hypothetical protein
MPHSFVSKAAYSRSSPQASCCVPMVRLAVNKKYTHEAIIPAASQLACWQLQSAVVSASQRLGQLQRCVPENRGHSRSVQ